MWFQKCFECEKYLLFSNWNGLEKKTLAKYDLNKRKDIFRLIIRENQRKVKNCPMVWFESKTYAASDDLKINSTGKTVIMTNDKYYI